MKNVQLKAFGLIASILLTGPVAAQEVREIREITTVEEAKKAVAYFEPGSVRNDWIAVFSCTAGFAGLGFSASRLLVEGIGCLLNLSNDTKDLAKITVSVPCAAFGGLMGGGKIAQNTHERYDNRARPLCQALNGTNAAVIKAIQDGEGYPFVLERCNKLKD
jgi:hypothetical protein